MPSFTICVPLSSFLSFCFTALQEISGKCLKKIGERGRPCFISSEWENFQVSQFLSMMLAACFSQAAINFRKVPFISGLLRILNMLDVGDFQMFFFCISCYDNTFSFLPWMYVSWTWGSVGGFYILSFYVDGDTSIICRKPQKYNVLFRRDMCSINTNGYQRPCSIVIICLYWLL